MTSTRLTSALVFAAIFLTSIYWWPLHFLIPLIALAVTLIGTYEYIVAARSAGHRPVLALALLTAGALALDGAHCGLNDLLAILLGAFMLAGIAVILRNRTGGATGDIATTLFGGLYLGLPIGLLMAICWRPGAGAAFELQGAYMMVFLITVTWVCDAGAYFVGRAFGTVKVCPKLSPGKTVEGLLGCFAGAIGAALLLRLLPIPGREVLSWADATSLGLICCIVAPLGDLVESVMKRDAGVKDSGRDLTGHGGILDVIDSLLYFTPAAYLYLLVTGSSLVG